MKKHIQLGLIILSTFVFCSCGDWLKLEPEDGVTRQEFWKTKEHVASAVTGCYASLLNGPVTKMFLWGELRADMLENGASINYNYSQIFDGEISPDNNVVDWSSLYTVINNCNIVLKYAPGVRKTDATLTEKQLKEYEAEALTIRAMMYFQLVRAFRDVPLALDGYVSDDQNFYLPKTNESVILDTLIHDLKIASANAPVTYNSVEKNKNRITAWSAKALLADIYLWKENYAACNALCQEIIGSGRFGMIPVEKQLVEITSGGIVIDTLSVPNESDADQMYINSYVSGKSVESIFEIPFTTQKTNPFYSMIGSTNYVLRPKSTVVEGIIFPDPEYGYSPATDIRGNGCSFRAGLLWKYIGTSRFGAARTSTNYTTPWIVYKYADVLLMSAEAETQIGLNTHNENAQTYYKNAVASMRIVRNARNAVNTPEYSFSGIIDGKTLEKAILNERAREFSYEGKRWYDVLRHAKRDNYGSSNLQYLINLAINSASPEKQQSIIAKYKDPKHNSHYWPIYIREIETNPKLVQNEFYAQ